jgi:RND family efflux transporter MFP subunit
MNNKKVILICGLIFALAATVIYLIYATEPTAQSEGAIKTTAMLVSVEPVARGTYRPIFVATGTVSPYEDVRLSAMVSGQVARRNANFVPGEIVKRGTELLKINPADYANQLALRQSELMQAQTDLQVEMGRQNIAKQDLQLIGDDSLTEDQKNLVLRKPQYQAIKARIKAAEASVEQAQLNLQRTSVRAPFDAQILSQNVSIGSQVSPGDDLGRIIGIEQYWVEVNLPVKQLKWLSFPRSQREQGAEVMLQSASAWGEGEQLTGYLAQPVGALDPQSRLARVLIKIPDPLGYETGNSDQPTPIIGGFVEAQLQGKPIDGVIQLDRDYLRTSNTVWVMDAGKLAIREVNIKLIDAQFAYITEGLNDGDQVVTSNISTVSEGIPLRTEGDSTGR